MKPISISEQMMFNTVKLSTSTGSGTGFFFTFYLENKQYPVIITNKHVVNNKTQEEVTFTLHLKNEDDSSTENLNIVYNTNWYFHSKYDLCFCFINPIFELVKQKTSKDVFYRTNDENIIISQEKLNELSQLEEVVMIGYPIGLSDNKNNFPIFRKGYTATHPAIDFNGDKIGLVDMACFPGSSVSPIFILNEGSYADKNGNLYAGSRVIFLGIQYAVPVYNSVGDIQITTQNPTMHVSTQQMTNLGFYIKSSELLEFKETIKQIEGIQ